MCYGSASEGAVGGLSVMHELLYLRLKGAEVGERKQIAKDICTLFIPWFRCNIRSGATHSQWLQTDDYRIIHNINDNVITLEVQEILVFLDYCPIDNEISY